MRKTFVGPVITALLVLPAVPVHADHGKQECPGKFTPYTREQFDADYSDRPQAERDAFWASVDRNDDDRVCSKGDTVIDNRSH